MGARDGTEARPIEVLPLPEGVVKLETTVLQHPMHERALMAIKNLHRRARSRAMGVDRHLDSVGLLILGNAREGKTVALTDYARRFPTIRFVNGAPDGELPPGVMHDVRDADYRPVVMVKVPSQVDMRDFVSAILGAFGYKAKDWWDRTAIIDQIKRYVVEMKTELILIDEAHNLLNLKDASSTALIVEFLKDLLNDIPAQFVIAGLPELKQLPRYAPQLIGRLEPPFEITPYRWSEPAEVALYVGLLTKFEKSLGMAEASRLGSFNIARRLHVASLGGRIGWTVKLLARAARQAVDAGEKSISLTRLGSVYREFDYSDDDEDRGQVDYMDEKAFNEATSRKAPIVAPERFDNPFLCEPERLAPLMTELRERVDIERRQLAEVMGISDPDRLPAIPKGRLGRGFAGTGRPTQLRAGKSKSALMSRG